MAAVAAHSIPFDVIDRAILDFEGPIGCNRCQGGAGQIQAMAGFAGVSIDFVKFFVAVVGPGRVVDIVKAVGTVGGQGETA